jgi:hypothetical protein
MLRFAPIAGITTQSRGAGGRKLKGKKMQLRHFLVFGCPLGLLGCSPADQGAQTAAPQTAAAGVWQVLFDGTNLDRWNPIGDANWTIVGDTVRADSSSAGSFLVSDAAYADFDLSLEFWVSVEANSGP